MKKLKSILKLLFPKILVKVYHVIQIRLFGIEYKFTGMNSPDIFDKIYKEAIWGEDKLGNPTSGYGSYKNAIAYKTKILIFLNNPSLLIFQPFWYRN